MILEYKISEQDFLDYQIYTASKSDRINKKKRNGWILLTIISIAVSIFFYQEENNLMSVYFGVFAIITILFYPMYFRWRYKKHYKSYIKENYSKRFGLPVYLEIKDDCISSKDKTGEGTIKLTEIECIDETANHLFLKISTGMSLIIPKNGITNFNELKTKLNSLGLTVNDLLDWKWK